jgi:hypothetical protein
MKGTREKIFQEIDQWLDDAMQVLRISGKESWSWEINNRVQLDV